MTEHNDDNRAASDYPRTLGPYVLLTGLARGGMGEVHLAKHGTVADIQKYCVVKTLRRSKTDDAEYVARFVDEARLVVQLNHRNICQVFDVGRVGDVFYLAMELVPGVMLKSLRDQALLNGVALGDDVVLHIICEVLEALDYAHRHAHPVTGEPLNLVHRDVSPQNVMINLEGEVKLIDFGLAASELKLEQTDEHTVMGKLRYMSPEYVQGGQVDGRFDLFATAVMAYELLVGERYYAGVDDADLISAVVDARPPRRLNEIEPELRSILQRALAKDPAARTVDCGTFRDELLHLQTDRKMRAGARQVRELMSQLFPRERERVRLMLGGFGDVTAPAPAGEETTVIAQQTDAERAPVPPKKWAFVGPEDETLRTDPKRGELKQPPRTGSTAAVRRRPRARRRSLSGAAIGGVLAGVVVIAAVVWGPALLEPEAVDVLPPPPVAEPLGPEEPTSQHSGDARIVDAGPADEASEEPDGVGTDPDALKVGAGTKRARKPTRRSRKARATSRKTTGTAASKTPVLPAGSTPLQKFQFLKQHCAQHTCARTTTKAFADKGGLGGFTDHAELQKFWARVNACVDRCTQS